MNLDELLFIVFAVLFCCILLILIGVTFLAILMAIRYSIAFVFYPRKRGYGKIAKKIYTPSRTGYVGMGYPVWIPQRYDLRISIEDKESETSVKYELYSSVKRGNEVNVLYSIEPFTQKMYLWKVWR